VDNCEFSSTLLLRAARCSCINVVAVRTSLGGEGVSSPGGKVCRAYITSAARV